MGKYALLQRLHIIRNIHSLNRQAGNEAAGWGGNTVVCVDRGTYSLFHSLSLTFRCSSSAAINSISTEIVEDGEYDNAT